ncbi:hypothetical protein SS50377_20270 [Spironucleus salmonicida]|uniref:26S proteasome non-ATPase regulatory subunit 5 n=1 Tax=Spironucleus salmonicida TaxID=348837 RepID=V6LWZ1_9EUKA|nr:hypothetical protein SS50377_20270 [Spironucleus salmonicida]|eukprot:EST45324.1 Hypothetical protein SS50377_14901 [Spironucleus salmonicida]
MRSVFLSKKQPQQSDEDSEQAEIDLIKLQPHSSDEVYTEYIQSLYNPSPSPEYLIFAINNIKKFSIQTQIYEETTLSLLISHLSSPHQSVRLTLYRTLTIYLANTQSEQFIDIIGYMKSNYQDSSTTSYLSLLAVLLALQTEYTQEIISQFSILNMIQNSLSTPNFSPKLIIKHLEIAQILAETDILPDGFMISESIQFVSKNFLSKPFFAYLTSLAVASSFSRDFIIENLGILIQTDQKRSILTLLEALLSGSVMFLENCIQQFQIFDISSLVLDALFSDVKTILSALKLLRRILMFDENLLRNEKLILNQIIALSKSSNHSVWTHSLLVLTRFSQVFSEHFGLQFLEQFRGAKISQNGVVVLCKFTDSQIELGSDITELDLALQEIFLQNLGQPVVYEFAKKYCLGQFEDDDLLW